jgi:hypothetical protein
MLENLGTETRRDGTAPVKNDEDAHAELPLQALPKFMLAVDAERIGPASIVLAHSVSSSSKRSEPSLNLATETFDKSGPGGRDNDSEMLLATETHVASPVARDTDVEQAGYAPIGTRSC